MTQTAKAVLTEIADLFEAKPETWTQGHYARSGLGRPIGAITPGARCWCMMGAIQKFASNVTTQIACVDLIQAHIPASTPIPWFNDAPGRKVEDVVRVLREAAADT